LFRAGSGEQGELGERSTHPKPVRASNNLVKLRPKSMASTAGRLDHEEVGEKPSDEGLLRQGAGAVNLPMEWALQVYTGKQSAKGGA
jgi:hypothetical protein